MYAILIILVIFFVWLAWLTLRGGVTQQGITPVTPTTGVISPTIPPTAISPTITISPTATSMPTRQVTVSPTTRGY